MWVQGVRSPAERPHGIGDSCAARPGFRADAAGSGESVPSTGMVTATIAVQTPSPSPDGDLPVPADETAADGWAGSDEAPVSVLLVDSATVVREGLCALVDGQPGLTVVGHAAGTGRLEALDSAPDVIVTDIELEDSHGPDVIRLLRSYLPSSSILVLTFVEQPARIQAVLAAGADGYVLKTASSRELISGIRAVAHGETYLQPSLGVALSRWHNPQDSGIRLTPAEERILALLALGHTNAEMARLTGVSVRTVETHRSRVHQKLGRRNRAELVRHAWASGLLDADVG